MGAENPRTAAPVTASHPRMAMPDNLQDKLAVKRRDTNPLKEQEQSITESNSDDKPNVLRSCPSTESWKTDLSVHEDEQRIPDKNFRENLGNSLSAGEAQKQSSMQDP